MKSPSTLRQSGGADIKLKDRTKRILKLLLILLITAGVCCLVYFLVDYILNGSFVDWFESRFLYIQSAYSVEYGGEYVQTVINWYRLKAFLIIFFAVAVFVLVLAVTAKGRPGKMWKSWRKRSSDIWRRIWIWKRCFRHPTQK